MFLYFLAFPLTVETLIMLFRRLLTVEFFTSLLHKWYLLGSDSLLSLNFFIIFTGQLGATVVLYFFSPQVYLFYY